MSPGSDNQIFKSLVNILFGDSACMLYDDPRYKSMVRLAASILPYDPKIRPFSQTSKGIFIHDPNITHSEVSAFEETSSVDYYVEDEDIVMGDLNTEYFDDNYEDLNSNTPLSKFSNKRLVKYRRQKNFEPAIKVAADKVRSNYYRNYNLVSFNTDGHNIRRLPTKSIVYKRYAMNLNSHLETSSSPANYTDRKNIDRIVQLQREIEEISKNLTVSRFEDDEVSGDSFVNLNKFYLGRRHHNRPNMVEVLANAHDVKLNKIAVNYESPALLKNKKKKSVSTDEVTEFFTSQLQQKFSNLNLTTSSQLNTTNDDFNSTINNSQQKN